MNFPTLYHKSKTGKIICWTIRTENDAIITEYGEADGKKQIATKLATPKNTGKANATTASKQAELEAASMHKHRLDRKYSLTPEEAVEEEVFLPMLASDFEKQKTKMEYPVYVQPKLDGVRCLAFWEESIIDGKPGRKIRLLSRGGKDYFVPHIQKDLSDFLELETVFDGELYIHGETLQGINRLVKKFRDGANGTARLQYHVYDAFNKETTETEFSERLYSLRSFFQNKEENSIKLVETKSVSSEKEVYTSMSQFCQTGYEGAIVRRPTGLYELGYRSRDLLKVKTFKDAEFIIVGHELGTGRAADSVTWICIQEEGLPFKVVPKGSIEQREKWAKNAQKYYGKLLTVKFWNRTEDNIPQFPVGIAIRLEEDLP